MGRTGEPGIFIPGERWMSRQEFSGVAFGLSPLSPQLGLKVRLELLEGFGSGGVFGGVGQREPVFVRWIE